MRDVFPSQTHGMLGVNCSISVCCNIEIANFVGFSLCYIFAAG